MTTQEFFDISGIESLISVATQRDGGFHVVAAEVGKLSVVWNILNKTQEDLQQADQRFVRVDDDFEVNTLSDYPAGTLSKSP